ncbi:unnamed protein product [Mesocestoides corti]|uniref:Cation/H+ exchanger transmembrane domain-containing protein n=1 Tax=Mesocestoides corti TaxID=53468 RepID=A0A0R3U3M3_MESCO|nr:unnamed protein product [Mesocestoides corti]
MLLSGLMLRCLSVFTTSYTIFMDVPPPDDQYLPKVDTYLNGTTSSVVVEDVAVIFAATLRVNKELSATLRQVALATILTRAGLGLEPAVLRRIWSSMIRLTCLPCLTEALAGTVVAKFLMNWPWPWAAMMGFILAAVSPAVVVPNMLRLEIAGWGVAQGIPTLVMAASSLDDVLAITGFGIAQAIAFAKGDIAMVAVSGPLEVLAGALLGVCLALILWVLPPPAMEHSSTVRGMLLYAISISAITGTIKMGLPGAGALCCLICSLMCSVGWRNGMPWRFKHTSQPLDEVDTNKSNALATDGPQLPTDAIAPTAATEHHEYYHQHLRSLRRRLNKSGGVTKKNALAAVSRSRRFSLPEPKPLYEENDFNTIISGKCTPLGAILHRSVYLSLVSSRYVTDFWYCNVDQSNAYLRRSLSAFRPIGAKKKGLVRWNTTTENTANIHTSTTPSEDPDSEFLTTDVNSSAAPPLRITPEALLALDKAKGQECLKVMRSYMATCWWFVQPLLFCLIGADIPVEKLRPDTIGLGIASILVALTFRIFASVLAVTPSPLKLKEKIFVSVAWIPKATVQAAIGPLALDSARATGDPVLINWGEQVSTSHSTKYSLHLIIASFFNLSSHSKLPSQQRQVLRRILPRIAWISLKFNSSQ